ncbi:hypothetical protein PP175_29645 (plasmid) [Aneurinibacillus sp. Ricciae_BoGa-3]|uniref:hypothetical protein n=1 Tax=Aneurinibacillus sp. Ricciae_BoGa-3 TaxID=3022697 RepID=UPI0023402ACC|nr:hypothetical protein [Aneurinibacillus sp. Ricciae_BoGa-3]WCK57357.1 hypothetical protein PP175_29645 [Aneurinibacillus sp. Ricciae_BoGa-3]
MYLYHGTSFENAISILYSRQLKGKKAFNRHKNRYVSLSRNKFVARQFGKVVFRFEKTNLSIPIEYKNKEWMQNHQEIVEYIMNMTTYEQSEQLSVYMDRMADEQEFIVKNKIDFSDSPVTIYLIHPNMQEMNEMKWEMKDLLKDGDKIIRSAKKYEEFLDWL